MTNRRRLFLAFPGGASHVATEVGGARAFVDADDIEIAGAAGVSAGFLSAVLVAFGKLDEAPALLTKMLQKNRVLDWNGVDGDVGLCAWEVIPKLVDELLGEGTRMGDSPMPLVGVATHADSGTPFYFSKLETPNVLVRDVSRVTTAILPLAPMNEVPSHMAGLYTPGTDLFYDGGFTDNLPDQVFDDHKEPTVSFSLRPVESKTGAPFRVRHGDPKSQALAVVHAVTFAQSQRKSVRRQSDGFHISLPAHGSGLDFDLSADEIAQRMMAGHDAAFEQMKAMRMLFEQLDAQREVSNA